MRRILLLGLGALALLFTGCVSGPSTTLRGFGRISPEIQKMAADGGSSWVTFTTASNAQARLCGSKFLADYTRWGMVQTVVDPALPGTVLRLADEGWWRLGLDGRKFQVAFARSREELDKLCATAGAAGWQPVPVGAYPPWLDCYDNSAVGFWFLGGGTLPQDVNANFSWMAKHRYEMCVVGTDEQRSYAPGLVDTSIQDWYATKAKEHGIPYRMVLEWRQPDRPPYVWNRVPLPHVQPEPGYVPYPDLPHQRNNVYNSFEPIPASDPYTLDARRRIAAKAAEDPLFMGHHGTAEVPSAGLISLATIAGMPSVKAEWHAYLRNHLGLSLNEVGRRYHGDARAFANWDAVRVPTAASFIGLEGTHLALAGEWLGKADLQEVGREAGWFAPDLPQDGWGPVQSNDPMLMTWSFKKKGVYWLRRNFQVTDDTREALRFLHLPVSAWHQSSGDCVAYLNGQLLEDLTVRHPLFGDDDQCFAVGDLLRSGENTLVIATRQLPLGGYVTLSEAGRWSYPSDDTGLNYLFYDAVDFATRLRVEAIKNNLIATRASDPNRPIKLMAPWHILDRLLPLCTQYGAYPHDTGQGGACWAPWLARYALPLGIPVSSEPGGPPADAARMRSFITFYLMLGNSAVDLVFDPTNYLDKPDIKAWLEDNDALVHCIGKMEMTPPAIGVLRSIRNDRLKSRPLWSTDVGRGPLQAVGRTFNYVTLADLANGRANQFKVIIDACTDLLTEEDVDHLAAYVRQGGTFVAMHNTGQNSESQKDAWLISRLTGLRVVATASNSGTLHFADDEKLWPSLRGRELQGWGMALDWLKHNELGASIACEPLTGDIQVVARWTGGSSLAGNIAIAERHLGEGRVVTLGSTFWRNAADRNGRYEEANDVYRTYLDELLTSLSAPRESWVQGGAAPQEVFAEHWRSKNGLYDLYPVARITTDFAQPAFTVGARWRRDLPPPSQLREVSAAGAPPVSFTCDGGVLAIKGVELAPAQSRVYAAPRVDLAKAALYWFGTQQQQWPQLAPASPPSWMRPIEPVHDILPLAENWQLTANAPPADWTTGTHTGTWRPVRLGSFAAMGIPEDATARCVKQTKLPTGWQGQRIELVFDTQVWFWGINPQATLWLNGEQLTTPKPLEGQPNGSFRLDITDRVTGGDICLALEIDGKLARPTDKRRRPAGVTGVFYLQAVPVPLQRIPVATSWQAKTAPELPGETVHTGEPATCAYLETTFRVPDWPEGRLFLECPEALGFLMINGVEVVTPGWMERLDVSHLVNRQGENQLRWLPQQSSHFTWPNADKPAKVTAVPTMDLVLLPAN